MLENLGIQNSDFGIRISNPLIPNPKSAIRNPKFLFYSFLPAALDHSGHFAGQRQLPETNAAELELANETSRPATTLAAAVVTYGEFLFLCFFSNG